MAQAVITTHERRLTLRDMVEAYYELEQRKLSWEAPTAEDLRPPRIPEEPEPDGTAERGDENVPEAPSQEEPPHRPQDDNEENIPPRGPEDGGPDMPIN